MTNPETRDAPARGERGLFVAVWDDLGPRVVLSRNVKI